LNYNILRLPAVLSKRGCSRSTQYGDIKKGLYTPPVALGPNTAGWPEYEVDVLNAARTAGKSDDEIRALVARLVEERKTRLDEILAASQFAA
jgi:prophage regulatory protein